MKLRLLLPATMLIAAIACRPGSPPAEDAGAVPRGPLPECDPDNGGLALPDGFCALIVADEIGPARQLVVRENGDVFVAMRDAEETGGAVVALRDTSGDGRADIEERFGEEGGTGIKLRDGYLYFGRDASIVRYPLANDALTPTGPVETVVDGLPVQRSHAAKPFVFDEDGRMYVTSGAPSNGCMEQIRTPRSPGRDPCPELERSGGIWRFEAARIDQDQMKHGERYASGIRHAVAIAWNPATRGVYVVQHGRDQLDTLWPELFTAEQNAELPAEEFLRLEEGAVFSWPYCYYDPVQERRVLAPEYGGDGKEIGRCDRYPAPLVAFPAHWAPNDLLFYTGSQFPDRYRNGAFVAWHGSWNRAPLEQRGYKVTFTAFAGGKPEPAWDVFADGFAGPRPVERVADVEHRPMGLAQGPDGSLYISDSVKGRIWRVVYTGVTRETGREAHTARLGGSGAGHRGAASDRARVRGGAPRDQVDQ